MTTLEDIDDEDVRDYATENSMIWRICQGIGKYYQSMDEEYDFQFSRYCQESLVKKNVSKKYYKQGDI